MSEQSEHEKQEQWRSDVRAFVFALFRHWFWWLSATVGSGIAALCAAWIQHLSGGGKVIPFWVFGTAAATGIVVASFRAFCSQRRIAEKIELELQKKHSQVNILTERIKTLADEEAKAITAEKVKNGKRRILAKCLQDLDSRIAKVGKIHYFAYDEDVKAKECSDTDAVINHIVSVLDAFFDSFAATRFAGIKASPISYGPNVPDALTDQHADLLSHLSYLENHKADLIEIEKTIENKG